MGKTGKAENGGKPRHRAQPQRKLASRQKRSKVGIVRADWRQERLGVSPHWASESKMVTNSSSGVTCDSPPRSSASTQTATA